MDLWSSGKKGSSGLPAQKGLKKGEHVEEIDWIRSLNSIMGAFESLPKDKGKEFGSKHGGNKGMLYVNQFY